MRPTSWKCAVLVSLLLPALAGWAVAAPAPAAGLGAPSLATAFDALSAPATPTTALSTPFVGGVRYRPRGYYRDDRSGWAAPVWTQIHVGFLSPSDNFDTSFDGGIRIGPMVDPHIQLGVGLDWWHWSRSSAIDLGDVSLPGGHAQAQVEGPKSTADLFPLMAFVQVMGDENMPVIPYGGVGVGYEWLVLSGDDSEGTHFDSSTFGGLGWQAWGGAAIPLSGHSRFNVEAFYNGSEPENSNDFATVDTNEPVTLKMKVSGLGMRAGLSWGF